MWQTHVNPLLPFWEMVKVRLPCLVKLGMVDPWVYHIIKLIKHYTWIHLVSLGIGMGTSDQIPTSMAQATNLASAVALEMAYRAAAEGGL